MSFIRAATVARSLATNTRRYSTEVATKKSSRGALYFGAAGIVGLAAYVYLGGNEPVVPMKGQVKSPLDPANFVDFKLKKVEPYNHNTAKFVFELPDGEASLLPVASCVMVKASDPEAVKDDKGKPITRPYTPISHPNLEGELTLLVKKYETGNVSKYFFTLKPGDTMSFKGPYAKWSWKTNEFEEVGLIGGGSGITPLYQVLQHALADKANKTKFKLLFANVAEDDILLRAEFDALKSKYPNNFDFVYVLDKPPANWNGPSGYITPDLVKQYLPASSLGDKVKIFVCGPPPQVKAICGPKASIQAQGPLTGILKELGYTEDQVYKF